VNFMTDGFEPPVTVAGDHCTGCTRNVQLQCIFLDGGVHTSAYFLLVEIPSLKGTDFRSCFLVSVIHI
jgi:hypothetical protein